ncbi:GFA family protein [Aestuariivirga litoralis]|uniref:GFA family protein n=1 Tax=Aestuariivirga litoralis TaxID=2650924 RepID=UPI0018C451F1|nr:GFA family protein [Aestuariivirga litoralis]MBG1231461.1 GFA family protein [Aestuariivirga litoralis]
MSEHWTGGCQCGAVRYELSVRPTNACICHCRMCQKQFGNFFGAFADVNTSDFKLTRGEISYFKSSDDALRGFCRDCGTPIAYKFASQPKISVSIGSLDRHLDMKPQFQYGLESREPWLLEVLSLPGSVTGEGDNGVGDTPERFEKIRLSSKQHPDHDTANWPPRPL